MCAVRAVLVWNCSGGVRLSFICDNDGGEYANIDDVMLGKYEEALRKKEEKSSYKDGSFGGKYEPRGIFLKTRLDTPSFETHSI